MKSSAAASRTAESPTVASRLLESDETDSPSEEDSDSTCQMEMYSAESTSGKNKTTILEKPTTTTGGSPLRSSTAAKCKSLQTCISEDFLCRCFAKCATQEMFKIATVSRRWQALLFQSVALPEHSAAECSNVLSCTSSLHATENVQDFVQAAVQTTLQQSKNKPPPRSGSTATAFPPPPLPSPVGSGKKLKTTPVEEKRGSSVGRTGSSQRKSIVSIATSRRIVPRRGGAFELTEYLDLPCGTLTNTLDCVPLPRADVFEFYQGFSTADEEESLEDSSLDLELAQIPKTLWVVPVADLLGGRVCICVTKNRLAIGKGCGLCFLLVERKRLDKCTRRVVHSDNVTLPLPHAAKFRPQQLVTSACFRLQRCRRDLHIHSTNVLLRCSKTDIWYACYPDCLLPLSGNVYMFTSYQAVLDKMYLIADIELGDTVELADDTVGTVCLCLPNEDELQQLPEWYAPNPYRSHNCVVVSTSVKHTSPGGSSSSSKKPKSSASASSVQQKQSKPPAANAASTAKQSASGSCSNTNREHATEDNSDEEQQRGQELLCGQTIGHTRLVPREYILKCDVKRPKKIAGYVTGKEFLQVGMYVVLYAPSFPVCKVTKTFEKHFVCTSIPYDATSVPATSVSATTNVPVVPPSSREMEGCNVANSTSQQDLQLQQRVTVEKQLWRIHPQAGAQMSLLYADQQYQCFEDYEYALQWSINRNTCRAATLPTIKPGDLVMPVPLSHVLRVRFGKKNQHYLCSFRSWKHQTKLFPFQCFKRVSHIQTTLSDSSPLHALDGLRSINESVSCGELLQHQRPTTNNNARFCESLERGNLLTEQGWAYNAFDGAAEFTTPPASVPTAAGGGSSTSAPPGQLHHRDPDEVHLEETVPLSNTSADTASSSLSSLEEEDRERRHKLLKNVVLKPRRLFFVGKNQYYKEDEIVDVRLCTDFSQMHVKHNMVCLGAKVSAKFFKTGCASSSTSTGGSQQQGGDRIPDGNYTVDRILYGGLVLGGNFSPSAAVRSLSVVHNGTPQPRTSLSYNSSDDDIANDDTLPYCIVRSQLPLKSSSRIKFEKEVGQIYSLVGTGTTCYAAGMALDASPSSTSAPQLAYCPNVSAAGLTDSISFNSADEKLTVGRSEPQHTSTTSTVATSTVFRVCEDIGDDGEEKQRNKTTVVEKQPLKRKVDGSSVPASNSNLLEWKRALSKLKRPSLVKSSSDKTSSESTPVTGRTAATTKKQKQIKTPSTTHSRKLGSRATTAHEQTRSDVKRKKTKVNHPSPSSSSEEESSRSASSSSSDPYFSDNIDDGSSPGTTKGWFSSVSSEDDNHSPRSDSMQEEEDVERQQHRKSKKKAAPRSKPEKKVAKTTGLSESVWKKKKHH